jgi:hypothetical protein
MKRITMRTHVNLFLDDRRCRDGAAKANRKTGEGEWRRIERQVGCGALLKTGVVALT